MNDIELLKGVSLFKEMDEQEIAALLSNMHRFTFVPGQTIIEQNAEGEFFYVLIKGSVEVSTTDANWPGIVAVLEHSGRRLVFRRTGHADRAAPHGPLPGRRRSAFAGIEPRRVQIVPSQAAPRRHRCSHGHQPPTLQHRQTAQGKASPSNVNEIVSEKKPRWGN